MTINLRSMNTILTNLDQCGIGICLHKLMNVTDSNHNKQVELTTKNYDVYARQQIAKLIYEKKNILLYIVVINREKKQQKICCNYKLY